MNGPNVRLRQVLTLVVACALVPAVARPAPAEQAADGRQPMWRFAVSDDSRAAGSSAAKSNGVATVVMSAIAKDIAAQGVDFVLFPGDMVTGETNDSTLLGSEFDTWIATTAPIHDAGIPVYTTRGNHEYNPLALGAANPLDPSRQSYLDHFEAQPRNGPYGEKGLTYAVSHKNVKVIGFDQYAGRAGSYDSTKYAPGSNHGQAMSAWVLDEVNASNAPLTFVMAHEQIWPTSSHPDCLANDPDSRDALVDALAAHHGTYLAGHDHMYIRGYMTNAQGQKVPAFTVGTGGGGNYSYKPFDVTAAGYTGPDRYHVDQVLSDSTNPVFGYLLITVYSDDTWSGEFRGFRFNSWNTPDVSLTPISVMDTFDGAWAAQ